MTGIGYCEVSGCRHRTNRRFCRDHKRPSSREGLDLVGEKKSFKDSLIWRVFEKVKAFL